MAEIEIRAHAWFRRRPAPWWVLLLKGPEIAASGASLGRARAELAVRAHEWAAAVLEGGGTGPAPTTGQSAEAAQALARRIVALQREGTLAEALMPSPDTVFPADELLRAA